MRLGNNRGDLERYVGQCGMAAHDQRQLVPGITVDSTGQVAVDGSLTSVLCDLAIALESQTQLPVDVEHVVAAVTLAVQAGQWKSTDPLTVDDPRLAPTLAPHVNHVFHEYGGVVDRNDAD